MSDLYDSLGGSATKEGVHAAVDGHNTGLLPGSFATVLTDELVGNQGFGMISHPDGVGHKSLVALLAYHEKLPGADGHLYRLFQDAAAMNVDDAACVCPFGPFVLTSTVNRNSAVFTDEMLALVVSGSRAVCNQLTAAGVPTYLASGETADLGHGTQNLVMDSNVTCRFALKHAVNANNMAPGDVIIGFSSTGQARGEDAPNSSVGANGLTALINSLLAPYYADTYPWVKNGQLSAKNRHKQFRGQYLLTDPLPGDPYHTIASALLSPTRLYAPLLKRIFFWAMDHFPGGVRDIHGIIHATGGGQTKIGKFGRRYKPDGTPYQGNGLIYDKHDLFPVPPLFAAMMETGFTTWHGMYQDFNMGHMLEVVGPEHIADPCSIIAAAFGIEAKVIGTVKENDQSGNLVVVSGADRQRHPYYFAPLRAA